MNTTIAKGKTKMVAKQGITRLTDIGIDPHINVDGCLVQLEVVEGFDYYLVNTDEFLPYAAKGSVLNVHTDQDGTFITPRELALVAGNNRLEIRPASKLNGAQVVGSIWEIRRWPLAEIESL